MTGALICAVSPQHADADLRPRGPRSRRRRHDHHRANGAWPTSPRRRTAASITFIFPSPSRQRAACGPALGGWISDHLHWWVIFLWKIPLSICGVHRAHRAAAAAALRQAASARFHRRVLIMAASSSFMLALNLGGVRYPWLSPPVLGAFAGALVLGSGLRRAAAHGGRAAYSDRDICPIRPRGSRSRRIASAGARSSASNFPADVSAKRARLVGDVIGLEPDDPDDDAQFQRRAFQPAVGRVRHYKLVPLCFLSSASARCHARLSAAGMSSLKLEIILFLIGVGFGPTAPLTQVALQNTVPLHISARRSAP